MFLQVFFRPRWKHGDSSVRRVAVEKLTNQALLAKIATTDSDGLVREVAVGKITDQALLAKIATTDNHAYVGQVAVGKITDQALLAKIATRDSDSSDSSVRQAAVENLTDTALLNDLAESASVWEVRRAACSKTGHRYIRFSLECTRCQINSTAGYCGYWGESDPD